MVGSGKTVWLDGTRDVLTVAEMYRADAAAADGGIAPLDLMEAAGAAFAERVAALVPQGAITVLCGPGNNGGDGFVAARLLATQGRAVRVALLGPRENLKGDAAANAARWEAAVEPLTPAALADAAIAVDAIFGAGLSRPVDGAVAETITALDASPARRVAVDVPSGIDGDSGAVLGVAARADETVTFFRRKPAHLLYPGRGLCGAVRVADIGIPAQVLTAIDPATCVNRPAAWSGTFPWPKAGGHKYSRGHAVVSGGDTMTGAARLASHAAQRAGAGLVTIFSPPAAGAIYRSGDAGVLVRDIASAESFVEALADRRITVLLIGPGLGTGASTRRRVLDGLAAGRACVLDADALSAFADDPQTLFAAIAASDECILTPHEGEFARLFGESPAGEGAEKLAGKLARARVAARRAGAIIVLKGADTVIAAPDGRAAINDNAPPTLATAGSGDVLAGFITGLLAQGMPGFAAACAGVWLHGAAAQAFGPGLIAGDIADALPAVLRGLADAG